MTASNLKPRLDPSMMAVADALATIPAHIAVEVLDRFHFSSDPVLRRWAIDEARHRKQEMDRRLSADATLREQRKQVAKGHIADLRKIVETLP